MLRFLTAGESHGHGLVVIVEGLPAGLQVTAEDIQGGLARRRLGFGRGPRMRFEADELTLIGGIRHGRTLGSPVAIEIANTEWPKWEEEMSPAPGCPPSPHPAPSRPRRPGRACRSTDSDDARDVLERASARETAARVAAGTVAKLLLAQIGIDIVSHVVQLGPAQADSDVLPGREPTSPRSTRRRCAASTPTPRPGWSPRSRRRPRSATPSAGWPRSSPTASRSGSAATSTGTAGSTACWPRPS